MDINQLLLGAAGVLALLGVYVFVLRWINERALIQQRERIIRTQRVFNETMNKLENEAKAYAAAIMEEHHLSLDDEDAEYQILRDLCFMRAEIDREAGMIRSLGQDIDWSKSYEYVDRQINAIVKMASIKEGE